MYIVFTGKSTIVSFLIGVASWSFAKFGWLPRWMSHAYIVIGDTCYEATATAGKVVGYPVASKITAYNAWEWRVNMGKLLSMKQINEAKQWLDKVVAAETMYDYEGIVGYALNRQEWNNKNKYFCYELVSNAVPALISKDTRRMVGRHLWRNIKRLAKERGVSMKAITTKV